jgi:Zn-dependent protease with chaperone function
VAEPRPRPANSLARRELIHRRTALVAIATLLVLAMSPLVLPHLPWMDALFEGRAHLWNLCMIALHAFLDPVHGLFQGLFVAGLSYAAFDRLRAWHSMARALAPFSAAPPQVGSPTWRAALAADFDPERIRIVSGLPSPAFTAGWLRPRVYVAADLESRLAPEELAAVLAHERVHATRRDPLRLSLLRFLACTLFWIPALRRLATDVAAEGEVRADDQAAERHGLALASALVRLAGWERGVEPVAVGFTGGDLLERRVLRLTGEEIAPRSSVTRRSMAGAGVALLLAWCSGVAVAHPLPADHDSHCRDHSGSPVVHLLCSSCLHFRSEDCPHDPVEA